MIYIVGVGPGRPEYMTIEAVTVLEKVELIAGFRSVVERFPDRDALVVEAHRIEPFLDELAVRVDAGTEVAVLVSGDPGVSSFATKVIARFGLERCRVVPGISSVQLAFARLGLPWGGAALVDLHGRKELTVRDRETFAGPGSIAVLLDPKWDNRIAELARAAGAGRKLYLMSDLGTTEERVAELDRGVSAARPGRLNLLVITGVAI